MRSRLGLVFLGWVSWLSLGCGGSGLRTQAEGGDAWRRYSSEHFEVTTDAPAEDARSLIASFERTYFVLTHEAFPYRPEFSSKTEVMWCSQLPDLEEFGLDARGLQTNRGSWVDGNPGIVLARDTEEGVVTAQHELVHRFMAFHVPQAPTWLNEGLAEYYQTMRIEGDTLFIGEHPVTRFERERGVSGAAFLFWDELLDAKALRGLARDEFYVDDTRARNYLSAWSLVSALRLEKNEKAFYRYLDALHSGEVEEGKAWDAGPGALEPAELRALQQGIFARSVGELITYRGIELPPPPRVAVQDESAARMHAHWARLMPQPYATREAQRAMELDANDPEVLLVTAGVDRSLADAERIRRLTAAYRASGRAARYAAPVLTLVHPDTSEETKEFDAMAAHLTKTAKTAFELNALARYLVGRGRAKQALPFALRAVEADASLLAAHATMALIRSELGQFDAAVQHQTWVVNLGAHHLDPEERAKLERYRASAAEAQRAAAAEVVTQ